MTVESFYPPATVPMSSRVAAGLRRAGFGPRKLVRLLVSAATAAATFDAWAQDERPSGAQPAPLILTPKDRVIVQRGFVPVDGALRLYACVVGTPAGAHYAYDLERGALLSVWRGPFADMVEIWGPRARNQTARPAGNEVRLAARPLLAQFPNRPMFQFPQTWPAEPLPLYESRGYELEPDGQPVFLARLEALTIRDRIAPAADGRGLTRRIEFSGKPPEWEQWVLIAEADAIEASGGGHGWSSRPSGWTIAWPADSPHRPAVRTEHGRQLLALRLERAEVNSPVEYTISW